VVLSHRIVLCLALMTASASFAQAAADAPLADPQDAAPAPPPPSSPEMEQPLPEPEQPSATAVQAPSEPAAPEAEPIPFRYRPQPEPPPNFIVPRIFAEAFGGVLGGVGMGIAGLLVGAEAIGNTDCSGGDGCAALLILITVPATFVGIPLGVQYAGQSMGGQGEFLPALGGTVLGTGVGVILGMQSEGKGGLAAGLIAGPILGSIVGYELSSAINERRAFVLGAASARSGPRVVPVVGVTPRGGLLGGLSGSF
jgi:hypothetical protein